MLRLLTRCLLCLFVLISFVYVHDLHAQRMASQAEIDAHIKKLQTSLKANLGNLNGAGGHGGAREAGGKLALVLYALLTSGEDVQLSPEIYNAVEELLDIPAPGTYTVGVRCHVWAQLPPRYLEKLEEDAFLLVGGVDHRGKAGYSVERPHGDNSTTQYNTLGVWEAAKRGIEFSGEYWEWVENGFLGDQFANGGWGYKGQTKERASMTAAGLTVLFITNDFLHSHEYEKPEAYKTHNVYQAIQRGLNWMDQHYDPRKNFGGGHVPYYRVGVERVGVASGYKYFKGMDWYKTGAAAIIDGKGGSPVGQAFDLIFLANGGRPVMINKLKVPGVSWDNRPRDVAKLTKWTSDESEKKMLWQVISIERSAEDLMDAPILYFASHEEWKPDAGQMVKIKKYIDMGGMLFTSADMGDTSFDVSMEELAKAMYPELKWQRVPDNSYAYDLVYRVDPSEVPLFGIHNGARWLMIHSPKDISWALQTGNMAKKDIWFTMANIFHYASERGRVRPKAAVHVKKAKGASGSSHQVTRVSYEGAWNPEPYAWNSQNIFAVNSGKTSANVKEVPLTELGNSGDKFAHMMVSMEREFSDAEAAALKSYIENGGKMFIEAVGGGMEAGDSIRALLGLAFPGQELDLLPMSHPVIDGESLGGFKADHAGFRPYSSLVLGPSNKPTLWSVSIGGEVRVVFSDFDLSNGVLDQPVWGVHGYNSETAHKLLTNLQLWGNQ